MELINILKTIFRQLNLIAAVLIISLLMAQGIVSKKTPTYQTNEYITILHKKTTKESTFSYENYYGEFSSNHLTSTILGWFKNSPFTEKIIKDFSGSSVIATKIERSNIHITTRTKNKDHIEPLSQKAISTLQLQLDEYNREAKSNYIILHEGKTLSVNKVDPKVIYILAILISLIAGISLAYTLELFLGKIQTNEDIESTFNKKISDTIKSNFNDNDLNYLNTISTQESKTIFIGFKNIQKISQKNTIHFNNNFQELKNIKETTINLIIKRAGTATPKDLKRISHLIKDKEIHIVIAG